MRQTRRRRTPAEGAEEAERAEVEVEEVSDEEDDEDSRRLLRLVYAHGAPAARKRRMYSIRQWQSATASAAAPLLAAL